MGITFYLSKLIRFLIANVICEKYTFSPNNLAVGFLRNHFHYLAISNMNINICLKEKKTENYQSKKESKYCFMLLY